MKSLSNNTSKGERGCTKYPLWIGGRGAVDEVQHGGELGEKELIA